MFTSNLSGKEFEESERVLVKTLRSSLFEFINLKRPEITRESVISREELNQYRKQYISYYLTNQLGELSDIEKEVINSIAEHTTLAGKLDDEDDNQETSPGERLADRMANFGGSWKFIILFAIALMMWIVINVYVLKDKGFDPYPFILLNLFLSCLAAIQAPVIMMSQNRQEDKDRQRSKKDYMINLKSEVEIHTLHEKLDQLLILQQQEMLEIQKQQVLKLDKVLDKLH